MRSQTTSLSKLKKRLPDQTRGAMVSVRPRTDGYAVTDARSGGPAFRINAERAS
jgi:hypothetical protein